MVMLLLQHSDKKAEKMRQGLNISPFSYGGKMVGFRFGHLGVCDLGQATRSLSASGPPHEVVVVMPEHE